MQRYYLHARTYYTVQACILSYCDMQRVEEFIVKLITISTKIKPVKKGLI